MVYGYAGVPHLRAARVAQRLALALALHCGTTAAIAAVAASLGGVVAHGDVPMHAAERWLLCGAIAAYFALGLLASLIVHGFTLERPVARVTWLVTASPRRCSSGRSARTCTARPWCGTSPW